MYVQQQIHWRSQGNLKIAPTTLAGNASTAFPGILLSASASPCNHFLKAPSSFGGEPPAPLSLQKDL